MSNAFRAGSKAARIVDIMNANADKPMEEVLTMIMEQTNSTYGNARADYQWMVRRGHAAGQAPTRTRVAKPVKVKVQKSKEEIERIKAHNLAMIKQVALTKGKVKIVDVREDYNPEAKLSVQDLIEERYEVKNIIPRSYHEKLGLI